METIIAGRRSGKTTTIVNAFLRDPENSYIICFNEMEAERVRRLCIDANPEVPRWLLVDHIFRAAGLVTGVSRDAKVYIDNLDLLLRSMYGNVVAFTMTEE